MKYLITYKYAVGLAIFISISYSYINLRFIAEPLYQTEATILPIGSGQNGNISGLASQFGINMLEKGDVVDLSSSKLVPEILNSRKLSRSVLNYKFDTRKFGKQKRLISILLADTSTQTFSEKDIRHAVKKLRSRLNVKIQNDLHC